MKSNTTAQEINIKKEIRCQNCEKLLAIEAYSIGKLEIKCHRCGELTSFNRDNEKQLIITDKNGNILSINRKKEEYSGYSLSEVIGRKPSIWGNQMPTSFYEKMWKELLNKKPVTVTLQNKTKSGYYYHASLLIQPFLDRKNEIVFFLCEEKVVE